MPARLYRRFATNGPICLIAAILITSSAMQCGCAGVATPAFNARSAASGSGGTSLAVSTSSLAGGTVGTAYSATLQASGGTAPYSWSISSGSLSAGLSLNASSGAISGTPTAAGTITFAAQVEDANSSTATKSLSIAIAAAQPVTIKTTSVPDGSTNTAYSGFLYAGGGTTPYNWSLSSGALPAGLTLNSAGDITGVPRAAGTFSFTTKVADSSSPVQTNTANFSMAIAQGTAYSVSLAWTASASSGMTGYNVYRSAASGNDCLRVYVDGTVLDGITYSYVETAVDAVGDESDYSTQVQVPIP